MDRLDEVSTKHHLNKLKTDREHLSSILTYENLTKAETEAVENAYLANQWLKYLLVKRLADQTVYNNEGR